MVWYFPCGRVPRLRQRRLKAESAESDEPAIPTVSSRGCVVALEYVQKRSDATNKRFCELVAPSVVVLATARNCVCCSSCSEWIN